MEEVNFNVVEAFISASQNKDIKNSKEFKILNENNIDTNELTKHEKDNNAGVIDLNYKDEKEKEVDGRSFAKGLLAFIADMPEETVKALMLAALNGTDVAANVVGVVFNSMTNVDPAMQVAFNNGDGKKFKTLLNKNIQEFSKYLSEEKVKVKKNGEGSALDSKAAAFVSMITQDTPYALPIHKKLKSFGVPNYIALPVAYGMAQSIAFSDDATLFLNSEQVQEFKKMMKVLPNTSEEKLYNTTFRMLEGTALSFLFPAVYKGLKFAKNTVPKYLDQQFSTSLAAASATGAVVEKAEAKEKDLITDYEIDKAFGEGASEKAMIEAVNKDKSKKVTKKDMQEMITKAEKADDQILFYNESNMTEAGENDALNAYIHITDPNLLEGSDVVFFDEDTNTQITYQKENESDDNWIILNSDRKTSYSK